MLANNLVISLRFLKIRQDFAICCVKRKWVCFTLPSLARHAKQLVIAGSADSSARDRVFYYYQ